MKCLVESPQQMMHYLLERHVKHRHVSIDVTELLELAIRCDNFYSLLKKMRLIMFDKLCRSQLRNEAAEEINWVALLEEGGDKTV